MQVLWANIGRNKFRLSKKKENWIGGKRKEKNDNETGSRMKGKKSIFLSLATFQHFETGENRPLEFYIEHYVAGCGR